MHKSKLIVCITAIFFIIFCTACQTAKKVEKEPMIIEYVQTYQGQEIYKLHKNSSRGYNYDAYILLPSVKREYNIKNVLVTPNNNGYPASLEKLDKLVLASITENWEGKIARTLNTVSIFPIFPRTEEIYYHAFGRDAYYATGRSWRLDKQLICMIKDVREFASLEHGFETDNKILLSGISANACFSLRFAALHAEIVETVVAGVPGIFPIFPTKEFPYPFGVKDISFDYEAWKEIKMLIYEGDSEKDTPWNEYQTMLKETNSSSHIQAWRKLIPKYLKETQYTEILIYKNTGHKGQLGEMIEFFQKNSNGSQFTPVKPRKEAEIYLSPGVTMAK